MMPLLGTDINKYLLPNKIEFMSPSGVIALSWMSQNPFDDMTFLVRVVAY